MKHLRPSLFISLLAGCALQAQATTFDITYVGVPTAAQPAIQYAADIWAGILVSDVPIKVQVSWQVLPDPYLAFVVPNLVQNFPGAPVADTWYAAALANSIVGADQVAGADNFDIVLDPGENWYYGTTGVPAAGQLDLASVVLQDIGVGSGFVSDAEVASGIGAFGLIQADEFPFTLSFTFPDLESKPAILDRFLTDQTAGPLVDLVNPSVALGDAMTGDALYFNGPIAVAGNAGVEPRMSAPADFVLGGNCMTLDEDTYPAGSPNALMTFSSTAQEVNHWPGPIAINIMRDIGWEVSSEALGIASLSSGATPLLAWPNPATDVVHTGNANTTPTLQWVSDLSGRVVVARHTGTTSAVADLAPGTYLLSIERNGIRRSVPFVKQ